MAEQLILNFPVETAFGRSDFFRSPANALAVDMIGTWPNWPLAKLVLIGPEGAGKSHLAHIWADETGGSIQNADDLTSVDPDSVTQSPLCVEDAHRLAGDAQGQTVLFHIHNFALERGTPLLITGQGAVTGWGLSLADLTSRLSGANTVALDPPDDALLSAVMVKQFADRQCAVGPDVIHYLALRVDRSFQAARDIATAIDTFALAHKRAITRRLAAEVLDNLGARDAELIRVNPR